jgi:serine/threonine protein kinase
MKKLLQGDSAQKVFSCQKSILYRADWRGTTAAIKHIPRRYCVMNNMGMSMESMALQQLQVSSRAVRHFQTVYEEDDVYIVMEWVHGQNIKEYMEGLDKPLTEQQVKYMLYRITEFLHTCNRQGLIYGDIKPENIIIQPTGSIRFVDFGCTRSIHSATKCYMGTPIYFPPEMFDKIFLPAYDVWGLGVLAYYLACGSHPFISGPYSSHDIHTVRRAITETPLDLHHPIWKEWTEEGKAMVYQMLEKDPYMRPTIRNVYTHPWFDGA